MAISAKYVLVICVVVILLSGHAHAFGAGNIASISSVEGKNWRHGDIEDMLKTVACLKHHKWTSMMVKKVYFGNWLRDYSQAVDVGTLKGVQKDTIRVLVWILAFMSFGYATAEFEVTEERLGVYRPEEHIDNPKGYADGEDARKYDSRLRGPVDPKELEIDTHTGMKNYIANEHGNWTTSLGYVKYSFTRAIHYGRQYASATGYISKGNDADLSEALRCLGQGLHCLEDFGAHSNYCELALWELGFHNVFPHVGSSTQATYGGKHLYPLITGTFGGVDFLHSVIGEANDHVTQSEVDQMNKQMEDATGSNTRGDPNGSASGLTDLLAKVPGTSELCKEAFDLQRASDDQAAQNQMRAGEQSRMSFSAPPNIDPQATIAKIYPILVFRDKVVRAISSVISTIPGLESLIENIQERITLFIMGLLAPYIQPLIKVAADQLKVGSSAVIEASAKHQYEPWTNPHCTDASHSLLSKDHFSNILNTPAGTVASVVLQYCAPRVIYAFDHPDVPVEQIMTDIAQVFHHPGLRRRDCEIHNKMFQAVETWARSPHKYDLNNVLSADSVKAGRNHIGGQNPHQQHGPSIPSFLNPQQHISNASNFLGFGGPGKPAGAPTNPHGRREAPSGAGFPGAHGHGAESGSHTPFGDDQNQPGYYASGPQQQYPPQGSPFPEPSQNFNGYQGQGQGGSVPPQQGYGNEGYQQQWQGGPPFQYPPNQGYPQQPYTGPPEQQWQGGPPPQQPWDNSGQGPPPQQPWDNSGQGPPPGSYNSNQYSGQQGYGNQGGW